MAERRHDSEAGRPQAARPGRGRIWALRADIAVFAVVAGSLLLPIARVGLWDPFELDVADAARRIAVNLLGAHNLTIEGALNNVPIRRELGRGELPFTSVALGFRVLGLSDWAGRLPLVLWALAGALATYSLVASFAGRRRARLSALVLAATPLYAVNARTLSGDAVTMAAFAIAVRGLAGAIWGGGGDEPEARRVRAGWLFLAALGLYAGFWARGLLIGVVGPTLGVALGALVVARTWSKHRLTLLLACAGVLAAFLGARELFRAGASGQYSMLLGTRVVAAGDAADFDSVLELLAHGAFPVSILLPFGIAKLFHPEARADDREVALRAVVIGCLVVAFTVQGFMTPYTGPLPFSATFACAVAVALLLADLNSGQASSRAVGLGIVAVAALLVLDFDTRPEKAFSAFVSTSAEFPTALLSYHRITWFAVTASLSLVFLFAFADRRSPAAPRFAWRRDYAPYWEGLRTGYAGNLWFVLVVLSLGFALWALLIWSSDRYLHIPEISNVWSVVRSIAYNAWWVFPVSVFVLPLAVIAVSDVFRSLLLPGLGWFGHPRLRSLRLTPSALCGGTLVGGGLFLGVVYYPKLMDQLSPKQVFSTYQRLARPDQPLGLLRLGGSAADYYAHGRTVAMESVSEAFDWLNRGSGRRFLMVRSPDLPELNAMFRRQRTPAGNLPVIDTHSSEILLVSNQLGRGEENRNPVNEWILPGRPHPAHAMSANLDDRLEVLGWEIRDGNDEIVRSIRASVPYRLILYYEVTAPIHVEWDTFVHIDGHRRRYNGDHETLEGKYPLSLLRRGDFVRDSHVIELGPNFTPGTYHLYFGLYQGSRRMEVRRGKQDDDRLVAGPVEVR